MKLAFYNEFTLGVVKGDRIVDIMDVVKDIPRVRPHDLIATMIERFAEYRRVIEGAVAKSDGVPLASVRIRPPLPRPLNIVCMAVNYMENGTLKEKPAINAFMKTANSIIGPEETMVMTDWPSPVFEAESELGLVIARRATNVSQADAMKYVFGYVNFIDGSARSRDQGQTFYHVKSRDTFGPVGPFIVTSDEIPNPHNLKVTQWINGKVSQDFHTSDMAHQIPRCIEWVTSIMTLEPGDILATGTNHRGLTPFMDGDVIESEVEGLGRLRVKVRDDLKRTWVRNTRHERGQTGPVSNAKQLTGKYAELSKP